MCACGEKLEHDKPVFCPQCQNYEVKFTQVKCFGRMTETMYYIN